MRETAKRDTGTLRAEAPRGNGASCKGLGANPRVRGLSPAGERIRKQCAPAVLRLC